MLALGKVPGPETESVSREGASLAELWSEEAVVAELNSGKMFRRSKVMQEVSSRY